MDWIASDNLLGYGSDCIGLDNPIDLLDGMKYLAKPLNRQRQNDK